MAFHRIVPMYIFMPNFRFYLCSSVWCGLLSPKKVYGTQNKNFSNKHSLQLLLPFVVWILISRFSLARIIIICWQLCTKHGLLGSFSRECLPKKAFRNQWNFFPHRSCLPLPSLSIFVVSLWWWKIVTEVENVWQSKS